MSRDHAYITRRLRIGSRIRCAVGPSIQVDPKMFFTPLDVTFGDLFLRVSQDHRIGEQSTINKVIMPDQPRNGSVEVELGAPVALCVEFSSKYVTYGFVSRSCRSACLFEVGSFVLQVVFILSGQSPFDYYFFSVTHSIFKLQRSEQQEIKLVWPKSRWQII